MPGQDDAPRPPVFIHIDLDGLWTLAGCYGYPEGKSFVEDPVFERAPERLAGLLAAAGVKGTFFISGRDLERPEKRAAVAALARAGHELANHGWGHRIDLEALEPAGVEAELRRAQEAIGAVAGEAPWGYRAAGYAAGPKVLEACARVGIRYDGSVLPTPWAGVLRRMAEGLRNRVARECGGGGGKPAPGGEPQYGRGGSMKAQWYRAAGGKRVLRLPLAVSPVLRLPLQASMGIMLGEARVRRGLAALARRGEPVTWLLHGMDVMAPEELAGRLPAALAGHRGFRVGLEERMRFISGVLEELGRVGSIVRTRDWLEKGE